MDSEAIELLRSTGAIITDSHIVGTSGRHMAIYINKDALYPHTKETSRMGELFAEKNKDLDIDVVAAPALGGIVLSTWAAYHLSQLKGKEVLGVYTEKDAEKNQVFTRGYDKLVKGKNVLVIEDLTTTGGSVKKVVNSVEGAGGKVVQVCVMVNRDPENINSEFIGAPFSALAILKAESWEEADCQLCKDNVPINTTVGHGKKYLEAKGRSLSSVMINQHKIGVFGSSSGQFNAVAMEKAATLGRLLAARGHALVTGATVGVTHEAVKAAHAAGGTTIGYSYVTNREEQLELGWPVDVYTELHFIPKTYELVASAAARRKYRNISSTNASDAGIVISGQYGTMNEFTLLYDLQKPIAVLTGTGGLADMLAGITEKIVKNPHPPIVFSDDPAELLDLLGAHL